MEACEGPTNIFTINTLAMIDNDFELLILVTAICAVALIGIIVLGVQIIKKLK
jgi:hypothetical protein